MARELIFKLKRKEYSLVPVRIDRKKLYGWTEILALDDKQRPCRVANTDQSGMFIIPKGGTGLGVLSPEGLWVERSELITVDQKGDPAKLIPSSYSTIVELKKKVTADILLEHSITAFYELSGTDSEFLDIIAGDIYFFSYCYVAECEGYPAFILATGTGKNAKAFMMTGYRNRFEYLGLEQPGYIDDEDEEDLQPDELLDFSMF